MSTRMNYFNFSPFGGQILVTNDVGRYLFLSKPEFNALITESYRDDPALQVKLEKNWFVIDADVDIAAARMIEDLRCAKCHLMTTTSLFIFVVTERCNANCVYCQAQHSSADSCCFSGDMTIDVAHHGVDLALSSPSMDITFEFQGGEPLLNFEVIKEIVLYAKLRNKQQKKLRFTLVSNLMLMTDEILRFIIEHRFGLSTSLDGDRICHDLNRPLLGGGGSYAHVREKIAAVQSADYQVGAIQTTTRQSLSRHKEIVDAYVDAGLASIFIRPLTQLGFANERWDDIGYAAEEFVGFYADCLDYILELNKAGVSIKEGHASIWLRKIIGGLQSNYMELRSPCGAAIGQIAITGNGNIYTCDEARMLARMGDESFYLGNVAKTSFNSIMESDVTKAVSVASTLESLPGCCDCVFQPYCGVCPVVNLAVDGNLFARHARNYRCSIYYGMLHKIFSLIQRSNQAEMEILSSWI